MNKMRCAKLFCGFSLQTSSKIIGFLDLLIGLAQAVYLGFKLLPTLSSQEREWERENVTQCTHLITASMWLIMSALLIIAVYNRQRNLMLPWLAANITHLCTAFIHSVIESALLILSKNPIALAELALICCSTITRVCLWTIVCKFYQKLEREDISLAALRAAVIIEC